MSEIDQHQPAAAGATQAPTSSIRVFEDRYGADALQRLLTLFADAHVSYAAIALEFGVTRERVRQWHHLLVPNAPRGHARRRARSLQSRKRRLLSDPLFRALVRAARAQTPPVLLSPVRSRDGFRKREVHVGGRRVSLRRAAPIDSPRGPLFMLSGTRGSADFIFYHLFASDFLFVPAYLVPLTGVTFAPDDDRSPLAAFRNRFDALTSEGRTLPAGPAE